MAKKSHALVDYSDGLSIVLQWMERRRRDIELLLQKELYMLRRIWIARMGPMAFGLFPELPGFFSIADSWDNPSNPLTQAVNYERQRLSHRGFYAPGY